MADCSCAQFLNIIYPEDGGRYPGIAEVRGRARPCSCVRLSLNGNVLETSADECGRWVFFPNVWNCGDYTFFVQSRCGCCVETASVTATVSREAPAPVVTAPANGSTVPTGTVTVTGTAQPGATVRLALDNGAAVSVTADAAGNFSYTFAGVAAGTHTIAASQEIGGCASAATIVAFSAGTAAGTLAILTHTMGPTFRTTAASFRLDSVTTPATIYYLLQRPGLPAPSARDIIEPDSGRLADGTAARGSFTTDSADFDRILKGREVASPAADETGAVDGHPYDLYAVAVAADGSVTPVAQSPASAIAMPFDSGSGTASDPYIVRDLTGETAQYPDLMAGHPINRAGTDENARQLDNIEGMQALHDADPTMGLADTLSAQYVISGDADLSGYANAYGGAGWRPIGNRNANAAHIFTGSLTGTRTTITGLSETPSMQQNDSGTYGLIGAASDATVADFNVSGANIAPVANGELDTMTVGVVVGSATATEFRNLTIENGATALAFGAYSARDLRAGGIAGQSVEGGFSNCAVRGLSFGEVRSSAAYLGGLAGIEFASGTAFSCTDSRISALSVSGADALYVGGLFGYVSVSGKADIARTTVTDTTIDVPKMNFGGVAGYALIEGENTLTDVTVGALTVSQQTPDFYLGGVIGYEWLQGIQTITNVTVQNLNLSGEYSDAGILGHVYATDQSALDLGTFTVTSSAIRSASSYAGGAIGLLSKTALARGYIHDGTVDGASTVVSQSNTGGVVGDIFSSVSSYYTYLQNLTCSAVVGDGQSRNHSGGICGYANYTALDQCAFDGTVTAIESNAGGLIGNGHGLSIGSCQVTGTVNGLINTGGLIGNCSGMSEILDDPNPPFAAVKNTIALSYNKGTIALSGTTENVGGLGGNVSAMNFDRCFSTAAIAARGSDNVGGLIGRYQLYGTGTVALRNCYATGDVTGGGDGCGGLVGEGDYEISTCYSAGSTEGNDFICGVVGTQRENAPVLGDYALGAAVTSATSNSARIGLPATSVFNGDYALSSLVLTQGGTVVTPVSDPDSVQGGTVAAADLETSMRTVSNWDPSVWDFASIATAGRPTLIDNPE